MTTAIVQAVFDGRWRHAAAARAACRAGTWPSFLATVAPVRPGIFGTGRAEHALCLQHATAMLTEPWTVAFDLVPVWVCEADDGAADEWVRTHAVRVGDEAWSLTGIGGLYHADEAAVARARTIGRGRRWSVGYVVETRNYAPDVELAWRGQRFGVIGATVFEVDAIDAVRGTEVPAPTLEVPPFCCWVRVRTSELDAAEVRSLESLSVTVDEDGLTE